MPDFSKVINYVEDTLRSAFGVPGCDLQIMRSHEVLFRYKSGTNDYEETVSVLGEEMYFMYSCTKPITCAAALQLIESGKLGLDDPVSRWLPEFENAYLLKDGKPQKTENRMTVRHLFTMTAGFDYDKEAEPIRQVIEKNPQVGTAELVNAFIRSPLHFEPGERFQYSLCHDVLAAVIESVSGMRFSEYLEKNIFEPLGMTETYFVLPEDKKHRLAAQFRADGVGCKHAVPQTNDYQLTNCYESGGAGLCSTLSDYSRFCDAMACGGVGSNGARILKPETVDLMRSEQLSLFTKDSTFSCAAGPGYGYGLGVRTLTDKSEGQRSPLGEFGWDGAAGSYIMMDPEHEISIVFTMHVLGWPAMIGFGHAPIRDLTYEILGL